MVSVLEKKSSTSQSVPGVATADVFGSILHYVEPASKSKTTSAGAGTVRVLVVHPTLGV